jgi:hypothetical protein
MGKGLNWPFGSREVWEVGIVGGSVSAGKMIGG